MIDSKSRLAKDVQRRRCGARCGRVAGFTLIEMLTVLTIIGILVMTAAPSFSPLIASKRAEAAATDPYISLVTARSEATKRNADATLAQKTGGWQLG
jgi:type IV fimbrial biogenesis protein FimT